MDVGYLDKPKKQEKPAASITVHIQHTVVCPFTSELSNFNQPYIFLFGNFCQLNYTIFELFKMEIHFYPSNQLASHIGYKKFIVFLIHESMRLAFMYYCHFAIFEV